MECKVKENSRIARLAAKKLRSATAAIVIGNTIHLHNVTKEEFLQNKKWVKHELCHIEQYKRYGTLGFIIKYLWESILHGYHNNKYEIEARQAEES
ncbi:MAG TPA: hypothetical protein VG847_13675 [Chitinophagaceae bacterium]|nr:hypothetical protein [Chitinophagaceae bacterium]